MYLCGWNQLPVASEKVLGIRDGTREPRLGLGIQDLGPGLGTRDSALWTRTRDPGLGTQDSGPMTRDPGPRTRNPAPGLWTGIRDPGLGLRTQDPVLRRDPGVPGTETRIPSLEAKFVRMVKQMNVNVGFSSSFRSRTHVTGDSFTEDVINNFTEGLRQLVLK